MITIQVAGIEQLREESHFPDELLRLMPVSSEEKLRKITNPDSYLRSLLGEILARYALVAYTGMQNRDIHFDIAEKGKPFLKGIQSVHFNITHSGDRVACAVSSSEVGVDIEHHRRVNFNVAERFFSPAEVRDLMGMEENARQEYFFRLWTIKESYLKAIGSGLTRTLNSFTVVSCGKGFALEGDESSAGYAVQTYTLPGPYYLAACSREAVFPESVSMVSLSEILNVLGSFR